MKLDEMAQCEQREHLTDEGSTWARNEMAMHVTSDQDCIWSNRHTRELDQVQKSQIQVSD